MQEREKNYSAVDSWIQIARRENNTKRTYLIVNPCQGKHVPVNPQKALGLFEKLGKKVKKNIAKGKKVLVIAFAETATAIGAGIAEQLGEGTYFMQTTRENVKDAEYLYFSEIHSHETEQRIVTNGLKEILKECDTVVFGEDEVTTGNTICNLIKSLEQFSKETIHSYMIASILNGMDLETEQKFKKMNISTIYLGKSENAKYPDMVEQMGMNGDMFCLTKADKTLTCKEITYLEITGCCNTRTVIDNHNYQETCRVFCQKAFEMLRLEGKERVLVLGTEEFMYPALCLAKKIDEMDSVKEVKFHATTRSPILTSKEPDYPLQERYELRSLYDSKRRTFIYNLEKYDYVVVATDADTVNNAGLETLLYALHMAGNNTIAVVEWRE